MGRAARLRETAPAAAVSEGQVPAPSAADFAAVRVRAEQRLVARAERLTLGAGLPVEAARAGAAAISRSSPP